MRLFDYPESKQIIVSGDIHGDFKTLVYKLCVCYECRDTLLIVAGDCGFSVREVVFEKRLQQIRLSAASDSGDDLDGIVTSGAEQFIQIYGSFYSHTFQYCDTFVKSLERKVKCFADIRKNNSRFCIV